VAVLRILIVSNTYPPADISGVGALVYELAHQLGAKGHGVVVLTRRAPAGDPYAVGTEGPKLLYPLLAGWRYLRLLSGGGFDLVHVHESDGFLVVLLLRLLRLFGGRARLVSTLQVSYRQERLVVRPVRAAGPMDDGSLLSVPTRGEKVFAWVRAPLHAFLGRLTCWLSDALVTVSDVTAGELRADYGAHGVRVIYNGIRAADLEAAGRRRAAGPERPPTVLYVGRLRTRKAVAVLLEAFALVRRAIPAARLVVVGDGEQQPALEARKNELGFGSEVAFTGALPRQRLLEVYEAADVYCLPSLYEGFPVAILEAMAAALPVVATRVSGIPEAVFPGENGELVEPEDVHGLAAALADLLADPARARALGERGRQILAERFSIEAVARDYLELWQELLPPGTDGPKGAT
jgi:glycogen(starch) synthase